MGEALGHLFAPFLAILVLSGDPREPGLELTPGIDGGVKTFFAIIGTIILLTTPFFLLGNLFWSRPVDEDAEKLVE